jgi:hypothetical protein
MARKAKPAVKASQLQGYKYFAMITPLLERLRPVGTESDKAGNRTLFYDHYVSLLLLYFFSPLLTSLRGLQQATELDKVQEVLGVPRLSLGALSEASHAFDPEPLRGILAELAAQAQPNLLPAEQKALQDLVAVDGSLLPALPRMVWALWQDDQHKAAKLHLHFEVARGVPVVATVTTGNGSEVEQLEQTLEAYKLYVVDRGYAAYALLAAILKARSSFIARVKENVAFDLLSENEITPKARAAGVIRDVIVRRLGSEHHKDEFKRPLRLVWVDTGKRDDKGKPEVLVLCTDQLGMDAELVALGYRYRWTIELFFRWLKCILGMRHLLAESLQGLTIQVYVALLASVVISVTTGCKPTKRTFEMLCFYFMGWATEADVQRHLEQLQQREKEKARRKAQIDSA